MRLPLVKHRWLSVLLTNCTVAVAQLLAYLTPHSLWPAMSLAITGRGHPKDACIHAWPRPEPARAQSEIGDIILGLGALEGQ